MSAGHTVDKGQYSKQGCEWCLMW